MAGAWLVREGRLRAGWRILLYFALLVLFYVPGEYAAAVLPQDPLGWASLLVLSGAGLLAGWAMLIRFDGRPAGALGFALTPATLREVVSGFAVGALLIGAACLLLFVSGSAVLVPETGTLPAYLGVLASALAFFTLAAAAEEILFRGYAFQALVEATGPWAAVLLSSALFSLAHLNNPNLQGGERFIAIGNLFLAGVLLAFAYLRTRSLWFATTLHAGWNWTMAGAIGFPVSGLNLMDTPLYDAVETGADWWTGGEFGPEAGLAGTVVLLAGTAWLVRTDRLREPPEVRAMRPLVDTRMAEVEA